MRVSNIKIKDFSLFRDGTIAPHQYGSILIM